MEWLIENRGMLLSIVTSIIALASAISAMTKTKKDDGIVKKIQGFVDVLALNVGQAKNADPEEKKEGVKE